MGRETEPDNLRERSPDVRDNRMRLGEVVAPDKRRGSPEDAFPDYPVCEGQLPTIELPHGAYVARFARTARELDDLLRLRFEVFNLELGEGLDDSYAIGRDVDHFDPVCHHAIVTTQDPREIVGTIRIQTSAMAQRHLGFYSSTEFDLSQLPATVLDSAIEMGRACIARPHRNKQVLFLLWKALAHYLAFNRNRYLFGCCSLNTDDARVAAAAEEQFAERGHIHETIRVPPMEGYECARRRPSDSPAEIPSLFKTYLRYGAKVCSHPAMDHAFKTIDFFVVFDLEDLDPKKYRLFFQ